MQHDHPRVVAPPQAFEQLGVGARFVIAVDAVAGERQGSLKSA
jgi:hypothetical protein